MENEKIVNDVLESLYKKQELLMGEDFDGYDRVHKLLKKLSNKTCLRHHIGDILIDTRFVTDYGRFETLVGIRGFHDLDTDIIPHESLTEAKTYHLQTLASIVNGTYEYPFED